MATTQSGVGLAMKFFGKNPAGQPISGFKAEWDAIKPDDKAQLVQGLSDGTLTY